MSLFAGINNGTSIHGPKCMTNSQYFSQTHFVPGWLVKYWSGGCQTCWTCSFGPVQLDTATCDLAVAKYASCFYSISHDFCQFKHSQVSFPDPTLSQAKKVWKTKSKFLWLASMCFCDYSVSKQFAPHPLKCFDIREANFVAIRSVH